MPKATFYNLPEEKARAVFDAAVREFATNPFDTASINKIIKDAGIPRGSFYQYFEDKKDIYMHVLSEIGREKYELLRDHPTPEPDAGCEEHLLYMCKTAFIWAEQRPLYNRIGMLMEYSDEAFMEQLKNTSGDAIAYVEGLIARDIERGRVKPGTDTRLVFDMIYAMSAQMLKRYYQDGDSAGALCRLKTMLDIIFGGIAV